MIGAFYYIIMLFFKKEFRIIHPRINIINILEIGGMIYQEIMQWERFK